jgi:hypothetical protein
MDIQWDDFEGFVKDMGAALVKAYYPTMLTTQPMLIEHRLERVVNNITVFGTIDLVTAGGIPVDLKTAGRTPWQTDLDYSLQPTFYALLLGGPVDVFAYHYLIKDKKPYYREYRTKRTQQEVDWLGLAIPHYAKLMQGGIYPPNRTNMCKYCSHMQVCFNGGLKLL